MKKLIIYIVENELEIIYHEKKNSYPFQSIKKGRIIDSKKFMEEFASVLKREKIKSKLFGETISVIKDSFYNEADCFYIEHILEEMGFLKVNYLSIEELFPDTGTYIQMNETYMVIYLKEAVFLDFSVFKDISFLLKYFIKDYQENILFFGKNKKLSSIQLENKNVFYMNNASSYVMDMALKKYVK